MVMIYIVLISCIFAVGVSMMLCDVLKVPSYAVSKATHNLGKRQNAKTNPLEIWLSELAHWLSGKLKLNEYKRLQLDADMKTVKGEPKMIVPGEEVARGSGFEGHEFYEASSMRKIRGRYYFIYSSRLSHELCWAVGDKPDGEFKYGGTIISIGDVGLHGSKVAKNTLGNTHGSIVEINGENYIFYHRQTNRTQFSRQACAERIFIADDGRIEQVELTSCGLNGAPLLGEGEDRAAIACNLWGMGGAFFVESIENLQLR